jgi:anti-anti-sigma regulatory factor
MIVTRQKDDDILRIFIAEDINLFESHKLEAATQDASKCKEIHVELSRGEFVNSSFFSLMISIKKAHPNARLKIINPSPLIRDLIKTTRLSEIVEVVI